MNHLPQAWGRPRDDIYGPYDPSHLQTTHPQSHTQSPLVTGTSVVACKYKDGVVIAADNLASYGSLARFTDVKRLRPFNSRCILGFGGDVSDMQSLDRTLNALSIREDYSSAAQPPDHSQPSLNARNLHTHLSKIMYRRRSDFNPLWNVILVAGLDGDDSPFLASVDLLGTTFSSPTLATGFGSMLAVPILRRRVPDEETASQLGKEEALELVRECMRVLFYRDARSTDQYAIAVVSKGGEKGEGEVDVKWNEKAEKQSWAFADQIHGYGTQTV
ncbi:MAG: hypothetical protein Q9162_005577 [Coniocarpon cinnabarinum]